MCCFVSLNLSFSLFHTQTVSLKEIDFSLLFFLLSSFPLPCHLMAQQISNVPKRDVALQEPFQPRTGSSQNPVLVEVPKSLYLWPFYRQNCTGPPLNARALSLVAGFLFLTAVMSACQPVCCCTFWQSHSMNPSWHFYQGRSRAQAKLVPLQTGTS